MYSSELFLNELTDEQKKKLKRYAKIAGAIAVPAGLAVGAHYLTKGKKLDVSKIPNKEKLVGPAVKEIKKTAPRISTIDQLDKLNAENTKKLKQATRQVKKLQKQVGIKDTKTPTDKLTKTIEDHSKKMSDKVEQQKKDDRIWNFLMGNKKQAEKAKKVLKTPPGQYSTKDVEKMLKSKKPIVI